MFCYSVLEIEWHAIDWHHSSQITHSVQYNPAGVIIKTEFSLTLGGWPFPGKGCKKRMDAHTNIVHSLPGSE